MNNDQLRKVAIEALETCAIGSVGTNGFTKTYWFDEQKVKAAIAALTAAQSGKDEREALEAWGRKTFNYGFEPEKRENALDSAEYSHEGTQMAWEGWQARASLAKVEQDTTYKGWYCSHCQRGVDSSEVTFHEQHTVCGRVISDDVLPVAVKVEREPEVNSDMMNAGADAMREGMCMLNSGRSYQSVCKKIFKAMLAAAPQAQQEAGEDEDERIDINYLIADLQKIVDYLRNKKRNPEEAALRWVIKELNSVIDLLPNAAMQASPAQAEAHPCKDGCCEAKRIGDPQYGCGPNCCMEPFPQADTQQSKEK